MLTNCSEIEPLFGGMTYIQISIMVCVRLPWVPFWVPFWVPEVFLACGGTQGSVHLACEARNTSALHRLGNTRPRNTREGPGSGNPTLKP